MEPVSSTLLVNQMWTHKPQEQDGDYYFDGRALQTIGIAEALTPQEIALIVTMLEAFVKENIGADYLQVFEHSDGRRVWCICQLSRTMIESGEYADEDNYWTILLPEEY